MITFTEAAGMPRDLLVAELESHVQHMEEDALDRGELMTLSAVSWALANQQEPHHALPSK